MQSMYQYSVPDPVFLPEAVLGEGGGVRRPGTVVRTSLCHRLQRTHTVKPVLSSHTREAQKVAA